MFKCKCIKGDPIRGLEEGKEYFVDSKDFYEDIDGDIIGAIYSINNNEKFICFSFYNKHFVPKYYTHKKK